MTTTTEKIWNESRNNGIIQKYGQRWAPNLNKATIGRELWTINRKLVCSFSFLLSWQEKHDNRANKNKILNHVLFHCLSGCTCLCGWYFTPLKVWKKTHCVHYMRIPFRLFFFFKFWKLLQKSLLKRQKCMKKTNFWASKLFGHRNRSTHRFGKVIKVKHILLLDWNKWCW